MNRFRFYYEVAEKIIYEADEAALEASSPTETPPEEPPPEDPPPGDASTDAPPPEEGAAAPSEDGEKKILKDNKDKVDEKQIIKKPDETSLVKLTEQIDNLSIKIIEKKEKISTMLSAISFLNKIDDTKPSKYSKEEKYKKLNGFLTSKEYDNLSPSNLFSMHNSLKENFKIVQKDLKNKKDSKGMKDLKTTAMKAKRARFSKNINSLNQKIEQIKSNLANVNQIFNLKDFPKMPITTQKEIKLAQKNSSELIKKLS
jgi:hypothetical protein